MGTTTFQGPVKTGPVISGATSGGYRGKDLKDTNWVTNSLARYFQEPTAADTNGICASQTTSAAANLTLNGALCITVNGNSIYAPALGSVLATTADGAWARKIGITSSGNDSGITFTVTGTDVDGKALSETITGPNAGTVYTTNSTAANFKSVTKIATSGATTGNITVGTAAVAGDVYCRALGIIPYQSTITGIKVWVAEAFNAGTADPMEIGKSDDQDYLADIATAVMRAVTTTGNTGGAVTVDATQNAVWKSVSQSETGSDGVSYNSDVQVVLTYTPTGTLSTAGQAWIKVDFMQGKNLASGNTW
tara:strand:+ start:546 stop:1466 length:921 start_codon:yes stop_codon:yes gene_type:complete